MAYQTGTATDYKDLLLKLKNFLSTANVLSAVVPGTNTGNGTVGSVSAENDAPTETWTLTATSGGPGASFSVSGSVSGSQAVATSAVAYDNGIVAFTIADGPVDYAVGDSFTFDVTSVMGEEVYTVKEWNTNWDGAGNYQLNVMGPGSGSDEIYTGIVTMHNAGQDWFNWYLNGYTGYSVGAGFHDHPGSITAVSKNYLDLPAMLLWNTNIKYWFVANGRRYIVMTRVSSVYQTIYMGFILPYALPTQWPYPLIVAGCNQSTDTTSTYQRYSSTSVNFKGFPDSYNVGVCKFLDGTWRDFGNWDSFSNLNLVSNVWPYVSSTGTSNLYTSYRANRFMKYLYRNSDGTYPLFPTQLSSSIGPNVYGEFQGVFALPGISVASEDTITISGKTHLILQNTRFTDAMDFHAVLLE